MQNIRHSIDLHCHSTASDGELTPEELLARAEQCGITTLALTDHDNDAGSRRLQVLSQGLEIRIIPAVEFSCVWRHANLHVLAYGPAWQQTAVEPLIQLQKDRRLQRAHMIAQRLERVCRLAPGLLDRLMIGMEVDGVPTRPHFAARLVAEGVTQTIDEAFQRFLGAGKIGDVKICWPTLEELTGALKQAGALLSLAHPMHYKMTATRLRSLLDEFSALGGDAVELAVPGMDSGHFGWLVQEARRRALAQSFGSDFHGNSMPWRQLGCFPKPAEGLASITERW